MAIFNNSISSAGDLVTSREQTRAGFIQAALDKNKRSTPFIEQAKSLKVMASKANTPIELLNISEIRPSLISASGLSDKALAYFSEEDKSKAIEELIENFLKPAGEYFVDELVYRFLLIKGDSLGGTMRNVVGAVAQQKFIRALLSNLAVMGINYKWLGGKSKKVWSKQSGNDYGIEEMLKAITWEYEGKDKTLAFNLKVPIVSNNIDICLFKGNEFDYKSGDIVKNVDSILMLGELKGGIDPAGADEHWKTGNSALQRIRTAFSKQDKEIRTSFLAAAIEVKMATEIWAQLVSGELTNAANMTVENQLINYCDWIIKL